ncbi:uncharacterized protein HMPREF1541_07657 [Cyphellophora europaea CBS 101466]|uniref:N-acetyltransferase domain-containing protein n=1 Tax=Cyphellophora europaea (strain CBS 101466) TaxID=1220924 RepID=W2RQP2_CYPE1|nr:uncharacterized protein HMPREF1541_07657 [Cyphellophora europaea CBS 101466]ETN38034.1 hypothetical protein HMPREF1541_07657 [Cyphellophora europaea CBS 101466]
MSSYQSQTPSTPPLHLTIRSARLIDHWAIARLNTRAFFEDILFGKTIHPQRYQYPNDSNQYWLSRNLVSHFDYAHVFLLACLRDEQGREKIVGQAHWSRIGLNDDENRRTGWGLRWWDPRQVLKPLVSQLIRLANLFWTNRAADPEREGIVERSYGYIDHVWDPVKSRCPSLYLESMAVDPQWQGRGIGKLLVQRGISMAEKEGISASVISADGKEGFYQKCGFETGPVGRSGEGQGNPLFEVPGGLVFFHDAPGGKLDPREQTKEVAEVMAQLKKDMEHGWSSIWLKERDEGS